MIIGVGDTGLDVQSTFFYDPDHEVPYGLDVESPISSEHRKVAYYYTWMDDEDLETGGHGTHVMGTVCGEKYNGTSIYNVGVNR